MHKDQSLIEFDVFHAASFSEAPSASDLE